VNIVIRANVVDIFSQSITFGEVMVEAGKIHSIKKISDSIDPEAGFVIPGFIDAHVHIESSMLVPSEFAKLAVVHGTVATVSDPHEIANVCGMKGVQFMIENGRQVPFKFYFGAPSCVPATTFETAGAHLNAVEVDALLERDEINYLSEMMNFPGVLHHDEEVEAKINSAKMYGKPVDGHAPGLRGEAAKKYVEAGISTDHECFTAGEALEKLQLGMKILIREGSAAKNFEALIPLLHDHSNEMMFCSDDKHPDSLVNGHINDLCRRSVAKGIDIFNILRAACINPVHHYDLNVGLLRQGDDADFILVKDLADFEVRATYIKGMLVAENGVSKISSPPSTVVNNFNCAERSIPDFTATDNGGPGGNWIIEALDGQLITNKIRESPARKNGCFVSDTGRDILKMAVVNRYHDAPVSIGFVKNFGLQRGAIASSVAHDSHNIIAVGADDESLCRAVNLVIENRGGISCTGATAVSDDLVLPLPVAGLMSNEDGYTVATRYTTLDKAAKELGSKLSAPYMTLSFMALLVIPHLKLSDKGLFDGDDFRLIG
jgi:adenine deaminase